MPYVDPVSETTRHGYTPLRGKTFPIKDKLKALGGQWNADLGCWLIPDEHYEAARNLLLDCDGQMSLTEL